MAHTTFYEERLALSDQAEVQRQLQAVLDLPVATRDELTTFLQAESDLLEIIEDALAVHYILFQSYSDEKDYKEQFEYDQTVIAPIVKEYSAQFDQKFYDSPARNQLPEQQYRELTKKKVNAIELFRAESLSVEVQVDHLAMEYAETMGALMVQWQGEEKTLPQMTEFLQSPDRTIREEAWRAVQDVILSVREPVEAIMDKMTPLRHQIALQAGFANYRDYMFRKYERFDYTAQDCKNFHDAVAKYVVPVCNEISKRKKAELGLAVFAPWDAKGVPEGKQPLRPFTDSEQLVAGVIDLFTQTDELFADVMKHLHEHDLLDLDSRKGKVPGGFMSPLYVTNESFIFMNAAGTQSDVQTLLHEGGHATHARLCQHLPLLTYKNVPMESAEFASMGMELLTMDKWQRFYASPEELRQAQREQLEGVITFLPWAMVVDKFQHWLYEHPEHSATERDAAYQVIIDEFGGNVMDWSGVQEYRANGWRKQGHIFEVPFYYIEYAIAQLAAVQIWKRYTEDPQAAIAGYKQALALGSSQPLPQVYEAAGIRFDFSEETIKSLMDFVWQQLQLLYVAS